MWVRTLSLLPRARFSCERCTTLALGSNVSKTSSICDKNNDILRLSSRRLATTPLREARPEFDPRRRYLHAAAVGGARDPSHDSHLPPHLPHLSSSELVHQHSDNPKELCEDFVANICDEIKEELNTSMPPLRELAHYLFDGKGKYVRPQIVYLLAIVANKTVRHEGRSADHDLSSLPLITERQKSVCRIAEMIHTASLIHDDVIDGSCVRRGHPTIHSLWGESKAIITGDYILSVASHCLSETKNPLVVQIISQVVEDLVRGEFMQLGTKTDETLRFNHYLEKTYRKTASLLANCCKAAAVLAECDEERIEAAFQYGRNIGIAFQLVDDLLDFISNDEAMGKPTAADLNLGLATAPVLFALDQHPDLAALIVRRFSKPGDVSTALQCVRASDGVEQTKFLAAKFSAEAAKNLDMFVESNHRRALKTLTDKMLHRLK